jgi:hypothetical protein
VNSSAFSARLRQSAACAFRNDSSIYATQNATDALTSHDMPGFSTPAPAPARKIVD